MKTIAERVKWAMAKRGLNKNQLEVKAGFSEGYLSNVFRRNSDQLKPESLVRLSEILDVNQVWLSTGRGDSGISEADEPDLQSTPDAPPAVRPRELLPVEHAFSDEIDDLALEVIRLPNAPEYSGKQVRAAKVFMASAKPDMDIENRPQLMAAALNAAMSLDEDHLELTLEHMQARVMALAAPAFSRSAEMSRERLERRMASARKRYLDEFGEPPTPSPKPASAEPLSPPRSPAPSTTRRKATR